MSDNIPSHWSGMALITLNHSDCLLILHDWLLLNTVCVSRKTLQKLSYTYTVSTPPETFGHLTWAVGRTCTCINNDQCTMVGTHCSLARCHASLLSKVSLSCLCKLLHYM